MWVLKLPFFIIGFSFCCLKTIQEASKEAAKYGENDPILPMEHNGIDIVASLYLTGKSFFLIFFI